MAPAKNSKPADYNPWGWVYDVAPENIQPIHIHQAYRIVGYKLCTESKRTCKRNPYCVWGLGEKKWKEDSEGDDDDDPIAFRCEGEYAGLQNLGATCYVNSLLQLWFHNPIFRPAILKWTPSLTPEELQNYKPKCPLAQLQAIFARLKISKRSKIDPSDFVSSLLLNTGEQQDALELAKLFMDYIVKLLSDYGNDNIKKLIAQSAIGQLQYETECMGCGNKSRRPEQFSELNLSVKKNLSESLDELLADETISDDYMCSNCQKKNTAKRRMQLLTLPPILNFQLLRFVYDREAQRRKKVTQIITFPEVLDMKDKVHELRPNQNLYELKYHLTAVLIHNGQSASSGHYIAQINDLKNGEWLKFNDEVVDQVNINASKNQKPKDEDSDDGEIKVKGKKSKNSPSLSSPGAYMLVYTSAYCIENREPDPELHQYLVDLVRREDASFEEELNKNKSEKDFELAEKLQRRREVEWLYEFGKNSPTNTSNGKENQNDENSEVEEPKAKIARLDNDILGAVQPGQSSQNSVSNELESECNSQSQDDSKPCDSIAKDITSSSAIMEVDTTNGNDGDNQKTNGVYPEIAPLPPKKVYSLDGIDFISVDWIAQWLDNVNPVPPVENSVIVCEHAKLSPPTPNQGPCLYRIIPTPLATTWYEHYNGGPRFSIQDLCEKCVKIQCKKLRALATLEEDSKQVSDLVKQCETELQGFQKIGVVSDPFLEDKFWITKNNMRSWKRIAKQIIEESSVPKAKKDAAEVEIICEDEEAIYGTFNGDILCAHGNLTRDQSSRKVIPGEAWRIIAKYFKDPFTVEYLAVQECDECRDLEKANTVAVQHNRDIAIAQKMRLPDLYSNRNRPETDKPGEFFIISSNFVQAWRRFIKDPVRHEVLTKIDNLTLICEHEKFMYPLKFVTEFLSGEEDVEEMVCLITGEEWQTIQRMFECDKEIKAIVSDASKEERLSYEPDLCKTCAEKWVESAFKKQFEYTETLIYVIKREKGETGEISEEDDFMRDPAIITGKREIRPHNPDAWMAGVSSAVRRSQRPRNTKSEKAYKVTSKMTIKELKSKICSDFKTLLSDQHLFFDDMELTDLTQTLQDCKIPSKAKLFLEIDTAENGCADEPPPSGVETGFQGTLLSGFTDN